MRGIKKSMYNQVKARKELLAEGEDKLKEWEVLSNTTTLNLKTICMEIDNAYEGTGGINLKPFYQRDYKFTRKDESLLIESLLAGIPVPTIYLASDTTKVPHISNVIDGQHRLFAVYRFINNKFSLTGLEKYEFLNNKKFNELNPTIQNKLLYQVSLTLQFIHIQNNPELEIEIFTRYNKGTHPLTSQEIRNVVYSCLFNDWLNEKLLKYKEDSSLNEIYNISTSRFKDKAVHGDLYVMFSILSNGINQDYYASREYIDEFMKNVSKLNDSEQMKYIEQYETFLENLNILIKKLYVDNGIQNPFSKEIYKNINKRNHKFQTSIMMIMVQVYKKMLDYPTDVIDNNIVKLREAIKNGFITNGFDKITSSTTEPKLVQKTYEYILAEVLNTLEY